MARTQYAMSEQTKRDTMQPTPIGIIAATAEGAALCYRLLCLEGERALGQYGHPEVILHNFPLRSYMDLIDRDDWDGIAVQVSRSAAKLAQAGAGVIICPNNTLHRAFDRVTWPVPRLHIADVVAEEARRREYRTIGLLGTQTVMTGSFYARRLEQTGLRSIVPGVEDQGRLHRLIVTDLIAGRTTKEATRFLSDLLTRLKTQGCEAVILGCTELPLLIAETETPLPLLNSTSLLAHAALASAMSLWSCSSQEQHSSPFTNGVITS